MAKYNNLAEFMTACAEAIRSQKGSSEGIIGEDIPDEIISIPVGGTPPVLAKLTVKENGTYKPSAGVDGFSSVEVSVPTGPASPVETYFETVAMPEAASGSATFLTGNRFIKDHRNDPGFFAIVWTANPSGEKGFINFNYCGNLLCGLTSDGKKAYGVTASNSNTTTLFARCQTGRLSGSPEGYNGTLLTNGAGNLFLYVGAALQKVKAGQYHVLLGVVPIGTPKMLRSVSSPRVIDGITPFANGERGVFRGEVYESTMDNNTWTPESFSDVWRLIE